MQFAGVKLKKTEGPKVASVAPVLCGDSAQYASLMEETHLEKYLEFLRREDLLSRPSCFHVPQR